jgi:hypothetical protein
LGRCLCNSCELNLERIETLRIFPIQLEPEESETGFDSLIRLLGKWKFSTYSPKPPAKNLHGLRIIQNGFVQRRASHHGEIEDTRVVLSISQYIFREVNDGPQSWLRILEKTPLLETLDFNGCILFSQFSPNSRETTFLAWNWKLLPSIGVMRTNEAPQIGRK